MLKIKGGGVLDVVMMTMCKKEGGTRGEKTTGHAGLEINSRQPRTRQRYFRICSRGPEEGKREDDDSLVAGKDFVAAGKSGVVVSQVTYNFQ
jgi:hypothetical protein